jgi:hypothetical protein
MRVIRASRLCLFGAIIVGMMVALSSAVPHKLAEYQLLRGGGDCCIGRKPYNCPGYTKENDCDKVTDCDFGTGPRICDVDAGDEMCLGGDCTASRYEDECNMPS